MMVDQDSGGTAFPRYLRAFALHVLSPPPPSRSINSSYLTWSTITFKLYFTACMSKVMITWKEYDVNGLMQECTAMVEILAKNPQVQEPLPETIDLTEEEDKEVLQQPRWRLRPFLRGSISSSRID